MSLEQRLAETLHLVDAVEPSPDLFARVYRSLEEDSAHRRRVALVALAVFGLTASIVVFTGLMVSTSDTGRMVTRAWVVELVEIMIMTALVLGLAPAVKRFGKAYVAEVFRLDPGAGHRFIALVDVAYYLVFVGIIVLTTETTGLDRVVELIRQLEGSMERVALLLATMGVLHTCNLLALPVVGLVHSSSLRRSLRAGKAIGPPSPEAERADRVATRLVWGLAALAVAGLILGLGVVFGVGLGLRG